VCSYFERSKRERLYRKRAKTFENATFSRQARKAKILTAGIYVIFRGLKFEPDTEIGQKGVFFKGLILFLPLLRQLQPWKVEAACRGLDTLSVIQL